VPSEGPVPAEAGPRPSVRVFAADRGRHRGARGAMGPASRSCRASSGPGRCALPKQVVARPVAAREGGVNRRPASQTEAGSRPTEVGTEPEDRVRGLDEAPIRLRGPPHRRGGSGLERCGAHRPKPVCPYPLVRRSSWCPSAESVAGFLGQAPSGGAAVLRGLAPLTSPLRRSAVSSRPSLVSPMGLFPLRGPLSSAAGPRSSAAEAAWVRCPPSGPKSGRLAGQSLAPVARCKGLRSVPRSELRGGFRSIPSWVARDAPYRDRSPSWFRRAAPEVCPGARVASRCPKGRPPLPGGVSSGPSRRPPWGFRRQRARDTAEAASHLGFEVGGLAPAA
jgi:hypothetical protein